jgi:serine/threonine protein kinase
LQKIGDYDVVDKIAEGGMGAVYKAREAGSDRLVAIKVMPAHLAKNPVLSRRFEQEYNVAHSLDHPNIVRALAFGYYGVCPYLVMEFVEGESLGDRLEREQRLPENEAIRIISQIANGLSKAHKMGLVHRDVKPDNILLTGNGQAKLTDLGLVKELEADLNLTRTGRGLGTPHFMAPEQFRNAKNADARCDIYSLAATLYMMVTGELPFKCLGPLEAWMKKVENKLTPVRQLVPELSERVEWAIRRAMHSDPDQRPASCFEFIEDLNGHSTKKISLRAGEAGQEYWYVRYKDVEGVLHTTRDTLAGLRQRLKDGLLEDAASLRVARDRSGPFEPLKNYPEFRDIAMAAALAAPPLRPTSPSRQAMPVPPDQPTPQPAPKSPAPRPRDSRPTAPRSRPVATVAAAATQREPMPRTPSPAIDRTTRPMPQINLAPSEAQNDWGKAVLFVALAIAAGIGGFLAFTVFYR